MATSKISAATTARQQHLPTLCLVASMSVTYKRLLLVCCLPPTFILTAPILLSFALRGLNVITQDHGLLFAVLVLSLILSTRHVIRKYAPSKKKGDEALAQSRLWLPLFFIAVSLAAIRYVISPIGSILGIHHQLAMTPAFNYQTMLRLSAGVLLMGLAVVTRYVGPASVVRCSSIPLVSHPMASFIRSAWARCTSVDGILDFIAGPSEVRASETKQSFPTFHRRGRRYQRWTNPVAAGQILLSALVGATVAYTTILGWYRPPHHSWEHTEPFVKAALVATCLSTALFHLFFTALDGSSHELNPERYRSRSDSDLWSLLNILGLNVLGRLGNFFVWSVLFAPVLSIGIMFLVTEERISDTRTGDLWNLAFVCLLTSLVISITLTTFDEAAKIALCVPGLKLNRLLREVWGDSSPELCLDVMLSSLTHGDSSLERDIWTPTEKPDREDEEVRRNDICMDQMAHILLHNPTDNVANRAGLEQDILRLLVLEGLGGRGDGKDKTDSLLAKAATRHVESVKFWIDAANNMWLRREPVVVPLVRGLCAYAGGLGEALLACNLSNRAHQSQIGWQQAPVAAGRDQSAFVTWSLPSGAMCCAEYAIIGSARCVVLNLNASGKFMGDWKNASLSPLVPCVLHAAFRLSCGVQSYAQNLQKKNHSTVAQDNLNWIAHHRPELRRLLLSCDDAAIMIMQTLRSLEGPRSMDHRVQSGCRAWLQNLQSNVSG